MKNKNIRTMEFIGIDYWDRSVYKCIENKMLWKDITSGSKTPDLYSCQNEFDGEPDCRIRESLEIVYKTKYKESPNKFNYMMLDRLRSDCEYYLGYGHRSTNSMYYKDLQNHIDKMKELYDSFSEGEKPEWLTWEQILDYEKRMMN